MTNKPTLRAYVVQDAKTEGGKAHWTEVGALWPHRNGDGFDLLLTPGLSISGRIVCRPAKEADVDAEIAA